jgi:hypothetical protein
MAIARYNHRNTLEAARPAIRREVEALESKLYQIGRKVA